MVEMTRCHFTWSFGAAVVLTACSILVAGSHGTASSEELALPKRHHFVLVHGIGGGAWFFHEIVTYLEAANFLVTTMDLTSNGIDKTAVADDVTTVAEYTKPLIETLRSSNGQVILLGHSMGGGSIAYAMEQCFNKIEKAVFLCSIMPKTGQSFFSAFPPTVFARLIGEKDLLLSFANGSPLPTSVHANKTRLALFAFNQSPEQYVTLGKQLFTPTPYRPGNEVLHLTSARYGSIRRFYIRTGHDHAIFPQEQDEIIRANPQSTSSTSPELTTWPSSPPPSSSSASSLTSQLCED